MPKAHEDLYHYWYEALREPYGVKIETSDVHLLARRLPKAREDLAMPELAGLRILKMSPTEAWIVHYAPKIPDPA